MVVWLCSSTLKGDPYECCVLIEFRLWQVRLTTGINHTSNATAPIFQKSCLEQHISNGGIQRKRVVGQFDGLNSQFFWQVASILNLHTVIIDGDADRAACVVKLSVTKGICCSGAANCDHSHLRVL